MKIASITLAALRHSVAGSADGRSARRPHAFPIGDRHRDAGRRQPRNRLHVHRGQRWARHPGYDRARSGTGNPGTRRHGHPQHLGFPGRAHPLRRSRRNCIVCDFRDRHRSVGSAGKAGGQTALATRRRRRSLVQRLLRRHRFTVPAGQTAGQYQRVSGPGLPRGQDQGRARATGRRHRARRGQCGSSSAATSGSW